MRLAVREQDLITVFDLSNKLVVSHLTHEVREAKQLGYALPYAVQRERSHDKNALHRVSRQNRPRV
jgi:hypothetical protein